MASKNQAPKEILIIASKTKDVLREAGMRCDGDLTDALSEHVHATLAKAIERCKANNRSTVRPTDL